MWQSVLKTNQTIRTGRNKNSKSHNSKLFLSVSSSPPHGAAALHFVHTGAAEADCWFRRTREELSWGVLMLNVYFNYHINVFSTTLFKSDYWNQERSDQRRSQGDDRSVFNRRLIGDVLVGAETLDIIFPWNLNFSYRHEGWATTICRVCVFVQGGVKVLITGPWSELSGRYSCVFDQSTVPASLIQPGVLRCYCPGTHTRTHNIFLASFVRHYHEWWCFNAKNHMRGCSENEWIKVKMLQF